MLQARLIEISPLTAPAVAEPRQSWQFSTPTDKRAILHGGSIEHRNGFACNGSGARSNDPTNQDRHAEKAPFCRRAAAQPQMFCFGNTDGINRGVKGIDGYKKVLLQKNEACT